MTQHRDYQYNFSASSLTMRDSQGRKKKAATMVAVLKNYFNTPLSDMRVLDVGASRGVIDAHLAEYFSSVTGIDIDTAAVAHAKKNYERDNLFFHVGDALNLKVADTSVDVVICSQVYEHVPNAKRMMAEISRVLRPGGVCYFSASNRLMWNEGHYNLPLLSVIPRPLAHLYIRMTGKAKKYHELHFSYWGLRKLVEIFCIIDYTVELIRNPSDYGIAYMLRPGSLKARLARYIAQYAYWIVPRYIWLLRKPGVFIPQQNIKKDLWQSE